MNIPQSAIEPFGYTGIPCVQFDDRAMSKSIKLALQHYSDEFYESYYGINKVGSAVKIIQADLIRIAYINGAINVTCVPLLYPSQVVFTVKYRLPHSKKKCHVGIGIRITPHKLT